MTRDFPISIPPPSGYNSVCTPTGFPGVTRVRPRTDELGLRPHRSNDQPTEERRLMTTPAGSQPVSDTLSVGTRVDVHARYDVGRWVPGFSIAEVRPDGYRIRRASDGAVLTQTISEDELRVVTPAPPRRTDTEVVETLLRRSERRSTSSSRMERRR